MEASPEPKLQAPLRLLLPVVIVSALMASAAALRPREDLAVRGCVVHEGEWVPIDSQRYSQLLPPSRADGRGG